MKLGNGSGLRNTWYIFYYDLRKYYLKAPVISWGILFPLTIVLLLGTGFGAYTYSRMIPVGYTIAVLFASTSIVHVAVAFEKMSGSINLLLYLPIRSWEVTIAKLLGGLLYGFIGAGLAGITYYYLTSGLAFIHPWFFILNITLGSIVFSLITILIVFWLEPVPAIAVLNIVRFTMLFLGGLLIPKPMIPVMVRPIVYFFPSLYVADLFDYSLYNRFEWIDPYTSTIMLLIYLFTLLFVSYRIVLRVLKP